VEQVPCLTRAEETLSKYATQAASKLDSVGSWDLFVTGERGVSDIASGAASLPHKAARLLGHLRRRGAGVPLHTGPWGMDRLRLAAQRGSHRSAKDEVEFVCLEMMEFCEQGFWTVLPLQAALRLPHLRLSPLGVVPQRNRRSRLIVDYTYSGVNDETAWLAPPEAMQFGKALKRVLSKLVHADPSYGPALLGKIDIADGFYRIGIQPRDIPRLGVILPSDGAEPLVALPLSLPMGWVESPPYFTAVTETACDLLNTSLRHGETLPSHPLESLAATPPSAPTSPTGEKVPRLARMGSTMPRSPPRLRTGTSMLTILSWLRRRSVTRPASCGPRFIPSIKCFDLCPQLTARIASNRSRSRSCFKATRAGPLGRPSWAGIWTRKQALSPCPLTGLIVCMPCLTRSPILGAVHSFRNGTSSLASCAPWPPPFPDPAVCFRLFKTLCARVTVTEFASMVVCLTV
jgi:hypothetical protein